MCDNRGCDDLFSQVYEFANSQIPSLMKTAEHLQELGSEQQQQHPKLEQLGVQLQVHLQSLQQQSDCLSLWETGFPSLIWRHFFILLFLYFITIIIVVFVVFVVVFVVVLKCCYHNTGDLLLICLFILLIIDFIDFIDFIYSVHISHFKKKKKKKKKKKNKKKKKKNKKKEEKVYMY